MTIDEKKIVADPDEKSAEIKVLKVSQPIGDIYIASMQHSLLRQMTFFDVRRRIKEDRDVERYLGIQRPLNPKRVSEIAEYVEFIDATFPTSVIVAVDSDYAQYNEETGILKITNMPEGESKPTEYFKNLFRVIDGQHRLEGLSEFPESKKFDLITAIFVGSDVSDQAHVFATVNLEQTKVHKSLAYDLFALSRKRSPYKTCHNIAVALDQTDGSPFFERIKRLGAATEGRDWETITQATFVNALLPYISGNPKQDRDDILKGRRLEKEPVKKNGERCFRNLFIEGSDKAIGKILEQYFLAVKERWPAAWDYQGKGRMLNRTNGFRALMRVFGPIYLKVSAPGDFVEMERFLEEFEFVDVPDDHFNTNEYKPGSSGESRLRRLFLERIPDLVI